MSLSVLSISSACHFDFGVGRINPGTFASAHTSCCSGQSGSLMLLSCCIPASMSATQSSSLSVGLSKSPFRLSQSAVSEMLWGELSWLLSTGWQLLLRIHQTLNNWVRPPWRSLAGKGGDKGDLSDSLNAVAPSGWKSDHDALTISSVSEMYPIVVICMFWVQDPFWVAHRFWLPCHRSRRLWKLSILCNFHSSATFLISESFSLFIVSNSFSAPTKIQSLARANCLSKISLRRVAVGFSTASSRWHLGHMENWPPLRNHVEW